MNEFYEIRPEKTQSNGEATLKTTLDAMFYARLNVLHLHLSDFCRVAIEIPGYPELKGVRATITFSAYIIETIIREGKRTFCSSAPTVLSPRAARYDNRLKFKFVDFEEL